MRRDSRVQTAPGRDGHRGHIDLPLLRVSSMAALLLVCPVLVAAQDADRGTGQESPSPAISLRARRFVPASNRLDPAARASSVVSEPAHLLLQFAGPVGAGELRALVDAGIRPLRYVPEQAVLALVPSAAALDRLTQLRWVGALLPSDKVSQTTKDQLAMAPGDTRQLVVFHADVSPVEQEQAVASVGARWVREFALAPEQLIVTGTPAHIAALAADDRVAWLLPASGELSAGRALFCPVVAQHSGLPVAEFALGDEGWDGPGLGQAELGTFFGAGAGLNGAEWGAVDRALQEWARHAAIRWVRHGSGGAARSVDVSWVPACHSDGSYGTSCFGYTTLAHAFYPTAFEPAAGDVHMNAEDFQWKVSGVTDSVSANVFDVALHEIGHSLGVAHSDDPSAVMYPFIGRTFSGLAADDIQAIQSIYRSGPYCALTVSPGAGSVGASGGTIQFVVDTASGCGWSASSGVSWIRLTSASTQSGPGTATFIVDPNPTIMSRSAQITIAGYTMTVTQDAAPCTYSFSPASVSAPVSGLDSTFTVSVLAGCPWTARASVPWITVAWPDAAGSGTRTIRFTVAMTTEPAQRAGAIVVGGSPLVVTQPGSVDVDLDGIPDGWEALFGLFIGVNDAADDVDGDGVTNLAEYVAGSHPRGSFRTYFAEGATGTFFRTRFALLNPTAQPRSVAMRFLTANGQHVDYPLRLAPLSTATVIAEQLPGLSTAEFATIIEADGVVVADRTMTWDGSTYGAHGERSIAAPSSVWYLAEGATHSNFDLFYLLQNPNASTIDVEVTFLLPSPRAPITRTYSVAALSRRTIWVDLELGLDSTDVSAVLREKTALLPFNVERAMYSSLPGSLYSAGHNSAGITAPANRWFLAEGATGGYFDMFVLIANPNPFSVTVDAQYLLDSGARVDKSYTLAPSSRTTVWVDLEHPLLASAAASVVVTGRSGAEVIVERTMWWPGPTPATWAEAHNSPGTTSTGVQWAVADAEVSGAENADTYVLIANTSAYGGTARVTLVFEDGLLAEKTVALAPNSRKTVGVLYEPEFQAAITSAGGGRVPFGVLVESLGATPAQIVVESAVYTSDGRPASFTPYWPAGRNSLGTRLR